MEDRAALHLARNLKQLRTARGLTQAQLAETAGIPRPTWANLETGEANPTLSVLVRVAAALQVTLEELLSPPRASARVFRKTDISERRRGDVIIRQLLPDSVAGICMDRMELPPGTRMKGTPHTPGTREYLTCERGQVQLVASGEVFNLAEGDVVVFRGDQNHSYHNPGTSRSVAYSVVTLAPLVESG